MALSSVPRDSEEGRAFLQQRLALFGKSTFLLFVLVAVVAMVVLRIVIPEGYKHLRTPPYHIPAILGGVGICWLVCRRGKRSPVTLALLDGTMTLLSGSGMALTLIIGSPELLPAVPATLGVTYLLIVRA